MTESGPQSHGVWIESHPDADQLRDPEHVVQSLCPGSSIYKMGTIITVSTPWVAVSSHLGQDLPWHVSYCFIPKAILVSSCRSQLSHRTYQIIVPDVNSKQEGTRPGDGAGSFCVNSVPSTCVTAVIPFHVCGSSKHVCYYGCCADPDPPHAKPPPCVPSAWPPQVHGMRFLHGVKRAECRAFRHLVSDLFFLMKAMQVACPPISLAISHSATHPRQVAIQMRRAFLKCLLCARRVI